MSIGSPDTITTFCAGERISRSQFYKLQAEGKGPRLYYVGTKPMISPEARLEWRRQLEAEARKLKQPKSTDQEVA